jgi:hypothetical protein
MPHDASFLSWFHLYYVPVRKKAFREPVRALEKPCCFHSVLYCHAGRTPLPSNPQARLRVRRCGSQYVEQLPVAIVCGV